MNLMNHWWFVSATITTVNFRTLSMPQKETLHPLAINPIPSSPQAIINH